MSGEQTVHRKQLLMVGMVLCLLAALFAIEAKLAWYIPDGAPASQLSASKLQTADAPRLVAQVVAGTLAPLYFIGIFLLATLAWWHAQTAAERLAHADLLPRQFAAYTSPLFSRPPPVL